MLGLSSACTTIVYRDPPDESTTSTGTGTTTMPPDDTASEESTAEPADSSTGDSTGTGDSGTSTDGGNHGQACGNGVIEGTELCDCGGEFCTPAGLNGAMCAGLINPLFPNRVYTGGVLDCSPASCQFVFAQCTFCGDTVLNGNEVCELDDDQGPSCQQLGMGTSNSPLPCGLDCQWDTTCCEVPLPKECM
ncbi:MAG: hypothetical protein KDK70_32280 [Myxococcales bacterium]|nr:hypothetical protein [Myxococcales bacterium]